MVSLETLTVFALTAALIIVVPGPGVVFIVGRALAYGRRTTLASVLGGEMAVLTMVVAVAVGLGAIVERSMVLFTAMKLAGAAYLIFLGVRALRQRHELASVETAERTRAVWRAARDGFVVSMSNPKTVIFLVAVLPQFVDRSQGHVTGQMLVLGSCFVLIATVCDVMWCVVASGARDWLGRSPTRRAAVGGAGGVAMIGLGVSVAFTGRRD